MAPAKPSARRIINTFLAVLLIPAGLAVLVGYFLPDINQKNNLLPKEFWSGPYEVRPVFIKVKVPSFDQVFPVITKKVIENESDFQERYKVVKNNNFLEKKLSQIDFETSDVSFIVYNVHSLEPALENFIKKFEGELGLPLSVNLYWTGKNATGLSKHFDGHDLFILQIEGSKNW